MAQKLLQINFKFNVARGDYANAGASLAEDFANVPGCLWKIWLMNEETSEAGGIYLFADETALETFKASPLFAGVLSHPALSDFRVKEFEVMEELSRITRAPLGASGAAA